MELESERGALLLGSAELEELRAENGMYRHKPILRLLTPEAAALSTRYTTLLILCSPGLGERSW